MNSWNVGLSEKYKEQKYMKLNFVVLAKRKKNEKQDILYDKLFADVFDKNINKEVRFILLELGFISCSKYI